MNVLHLSCAAQRNCSKPTRFLGTSILVLAAGRVNYVKFFLHKLEPYCHRFLERQEFSILFTAYAICTGLGTETSPYSSATPGNKINNLIHAVYRTMHFSPGHVIFQRGIFKEFHLLSGYVFCPFQASNDSDCLLSLFTHSTLYFRSLFFSQL